MKVKFGLRLKFTLVFLFLMVLVGVTAILFLSESHRALIQEYRLESAVSIAKIAAGMLDEEKLQEYVKTGEMDAGYDEILSQLKQLQLYSEVFYLYVVFVENEKNGVYFCDLKLEGVGPDVALDVNHRLGDENDLEINYPGLIAVLNSKKASKNFDEVTVPETGENLDSVYVPILNQEDEVTFFVGVDLNKDELTKDTMDHIKRAANSLIGVMLICFFVLLGIVQFSILRPIYDLKEKAQQISNGQFDVELVVKGHDELSNITDAFNRMADSIAGHMADMHRLNEAYYRYVPDKILTLLKKESIEEIRLGNEVDELLTVMSFQLSDFDGRIRKKTTREMIDSINQILHVTVPVVTEDNGIIEKFQNTGFTAMYDNGCEVALSNAITMCQKLNQMVSLKRIPENPIGIGIAYGYVTIGIVGQEKRMAVITVSQYRDTACHLQNIAERYQAQILITQTAADGIAGFCEKYHYRTLGFLHNTYTGYVDRIYDVYDGDSQEEFHYKDETKEDFEKGVELYCAGKFQIARGFFIEVLKRFRRDRAAKEYLYLCDKNSVAGKLEENFMYFTEME